MAPQSTQSGVLQALATLAERQLQALAELDLDSLERLTRERVDLEASLEPVPSGHALPEGAGLARRRRELRATDLRLRDALNARIREHTEALYARSRPVASRTSQPRARTRTSPQTGDAAAASATEFDTPTRPPEAPSGAPTAGAAEWVDISPEGRRLLENNDPSSAGNQALRELPERLDFGAAIAADATDEDSDMPPPASQPS